MSEKVILVGGRGSLTAAQLEKVMHPVFAINATGVIVCGGEQLAIMDELVKKEQAEKPVAPYYQRFKKKSRRYE